jgi:hypothetical protein
VRDAVEEVLMSLQIPPLPRGDRPPSHQEMADLLTESLPESERAEGRALLLERILPSRLSGIAEHPKPRRLAEVVYEDIADELREADDRAPLAVLRAAALRAEVEASAADSLSLAIARYLIDHPEATSTAADWKTTTVERWMGKPLKDLQDEATKRLSRLDELEQQIKSENPDLWEPLRIEFVHTKLNLQSARSGSFHTASGSLYDFLSALGAAVDNFDIH